MRVIVIIFAILLMANILWEAFETIVLPRTVTRQVRITRLIYKGSWAIWRHIANRLKTSGRKESFLGYYGPLSLPLLLGFWAVSLIVSFALVEWALQIKTSAHANPFSLGQYLYMSGTTFFTLGYGDITPLEPLGHFISVFEAGVGIGFLALIISYIPVLYQAFSRREKSITMLDARAGTPPSAIELLKRYQANNNIDALTEFLLNWEGWAAELLESHLSYPVLAYYRSQHDRESWLSAITMIMDLCAIIIAGVDCKARAQAKLTFAMCRHTAVDLSQIFEIDPVKSVASRLNDEEARKIFELLIDQGLAQEATEAVMQKFTDLRKQYEPFVEAMSRYFEMPLAPWLPTPGSRDNWQTSPWQYVTEGHLS